MRLSTLSLLIAIIIPSTLFSQNIDKIIRDPSRNLKVIRQKADAYFRLYGKSGTGWNEWNRFQDISSHRVLKNGDLVDLDSADKAALREWKNKQPSDNGYNKTQTGISNWTPLGQANPTVPAGDELNGVGSIRCMERVGNNDPASFWIGTPGGGMWYGSYISGSNYSWSAKTDGIPNLAITDIEIAPTNPSRMYALTGAVGTASGYRSTGVITSIDAGTTWDTTALNFPADLNIKGYKLQSSTISSFGIWAATDTGLFRTIDGGVSWNRVVYHEPGGVNNIPIDFPIYDIVYKPGSQTVLYAVGDNWFGISTDGGTSFEHKDNVTVGLNDAGTNRLTLGVSPASPTYVYIMYSNLVNANFRGLYLSANGGENFVAKSNSSPYGYILGSQSWRNCALTISPTNIKDVWVGGLDVYESIDFGASWTKKSDWQATATDDFCHADIFSLEATAAYVYACTDGGIYRMTRSTSNWVTLNNNMQIAQSYRLGADPSALAIFATMGNQDNGTYRNSGSVYKSIGGADGMETVIKPTDYSVIYTSSQYGSIRRSDDDGTTSVGVFNSNIANALTCFGCDQGAWTTPFVLRPGLPTHLYVGYRNIYYNTTSGSGGSAAWTYLYSAFTTSIISMEFAPNNNAIFYATNGTQVRRFDLSGSTWTGTNIYGTLPADIQISELAVDPDNSSHVVLTIDGYAATQKVFETFTANYPSPIWTNITRNLPNTPVNCVVVDGDANNTIYIGTDIGVFVTNSNRVNWVYFSSGLPTTRVYDLEINTASSPDKIFAATFGRGVWVAETYTGCAVSATLTGVIEGLHYTETSTSISSSQYIWGGVGTSVGYNSLGSITLTPGFEIRAGSKLEAYIQGCTTAGNAPRPLRKLPQADKDKPPVYIFAPAGPDNH